MQVKVRERRPKKKEIERKQGQATVASWRDVWIEQRREDGGIEAGHHKFLNGLQGPLQGQAVLRVLLDLRFRFQCGSAEIDSHIETMEASQ